MVSNFKYPSKYGIFIKNYNKFMVKTTLINKIRYKTYKFSDSAEELPSSLGNWENSSNWKLSHIL